jgi:hypothetical protein
MSFPGWFRQSLLFLCRLFVGSIEIEVTGHITPNAVNVISDISSGIGLGVNQLD